ncbi:BnaA06g09780D [Brassica napus]|uniref:BnaA06g09780D protein n=1 Tax=Brassica napus TaxID=3708 RepID=A0A078HDX3_BRANA|nr:BnaA06g09780D [Brassica napus]
MLGAGFQLTKLNDVSNGGSIHSQKGSALEATTSNVERFLESVTPSVPAHYLSTSKNFFVLLLLTLFLEMCGNRLLSGVLTALELLSLCLTATKDRVIQYYVPSLSAIQIYTDQARGAGEESDSDFKDSSSEGSSSESERGLSGGMDQLSLRKEHREDSSSDDGEPLSSHGRLVFEYLERDLPYIREPFADKMSDLASRFHELKTLRSCDLLPSSWFSVAWYPIYKIPTGPTVKDLDACFLTYHSLHTPFHGKLTSVTTQSMCEVQPMESVEKTALPVFGLASYKLRGSVWTSIKGSGNHQLVNSLFQAADNWLRLHKVNHPDFIFFSR